MVIKRLEKVIDKGGKVAADSKKNEWYNFTLRIRTDMMKEIEDALQETVGLNKTGYILQAIQDRLRKKDD
jgi:hypothetical protein